MQPGHTIRGKTRLAHGQHVDGAPEVLRRIQSVLASRHLQHMVPRRINHLTTLFIVKGIDAIEK